MLAFTGLCDGLNRLNPKKGFATNSKTARIKKILAGFKKRIFMLSTLEIQRSEEIVYY
jgi:hypothetical protein